MTFQKKEGAPNPFSPIMEKAKIFFQTGATRNLKFRKEQLHRLKLGLLEWEDRILEALQKDLKKPSFEAYVSEIWFTKQEIDFATRNLAAWSKSQRVRPNFINLASRCSIHREPYGVALILGPWNYPLQLLFCPLVSAIAAGNCAVLKPSEATPFTSEVMVSLVSHYLQPDLVQIVQGDAQTASELLDLPFDYIFYTGSPTVGRIVMKAAAKQLIPVTLELGGKNPCILDSNVSLPQAARSIALGKFFNAGQTCLSPDYVCVPENLHDSFCELFLRTIQTFYGENPQDSPDYARIINSFHFKRLQALLSPTAISVGDHNLKTLSFAPTLLPKAQWDEPAMKEEIFGPILPIVSYPNLDDLLGLIRNRPKPLSLYIFTSSKRFSREVISKTSSGNVCINDTLMQASPQTLPFGGVGESGMGRYRGFFGFETFSYSRSVMEKFFLKDLFKVFPPYRNKLKQIKKWIG